MEIILAGAAGLAAGAWVGWTLRERRRSPAPPEGSSRDRDDIRARFLADVSHELRTPLTLIAGNIESVQQGDVERAPYRLEVARRNARRLHRLVDELLELSRMDAGALELHPLPLELNGVLRTAVESFESVAELKDIELSLETSEHPIPLSADPDKLETVLYNLLSNAVKATPGGRIRVSAAREGGWARIEVEDDGVGIPQEALAHVFERFYRSPGDSGRRSVGSGIGLALVRELVTLHEGEISVDSPKGRGTRFAVRLPVAVGVDAPAIRLREGEPPRPAWMPAGGPAELATLDDPQGLVAELSQEDADLVLVVEDSKEMRAYIRACLEDSFRIAEAGSGEEAVELARDAVPDLVVADVVMPGMGGYELVRSLRADPLTSHVPVVMLTAQVEEKSRLEGLEAGADDYLAKPFSRRELHARVTNLLALRSLLRERYATTPVIRPSEVEATPVDRAFLEEVVTTVEEHMGDPDFSVEALAAMMHISSSQLTRKLRALIDQPPGRLIRSLRLQRAAALLEADAGNVGTIAYRVGFSDQAHFSRSFKKHFGVPPSEYRSA